MDDEQEVQGPWRADESTLYFSAHSWDYVGLHTQSLARAIANRHNAALQAAIEAERTAERDRQDRTAVELIALRHVERTLRRRRLALTQGSEDAWWAVDGDLATVEATRGKGKQEQ